MNDNLRGEASHDRQKSDKITDMKDHFYINKNDSGCPLYWADDVAYNNDVVWQCKYRADAKREGKKVPIERRTIVLLYTKKNRNVLDAYLGNEFEHGQPHRLKVASEKRVTVTLKKFYYQSAGKNICIHSGNKKISMKIFVSNRELVNVKETPKFLEI